MLSMKKNSQFLVVNCISVPLPIQQMEIESLCFRVVRPSVRAGILRPACRPLEFKRYSLVSIAAVKVPASYPPQQASLYAHETAMQPRGSHNLLALHTLSSEFGRHAFSYAPICMEQVTAVHPISEQFLLIQMSSKNPSVCSSSGIQRAAQTVFGVYLKRTCSRVTIVHPAHQGFLTIMRYTNPRTHSLTHSLTHH